MSEIRNVLVPTDFSTHATTALAYATALVKRLGGKLHVIHAYHLPVQIATPDQVVIPRDFWTGIRDAARQKLAEACDKSSAEGVEVESHLTEMPAAPAITHHAEELGADLVVMGTRGLTGLKHVLLGSVAERTLRKAPCPVLTVQEDAQAPEPLQLRTILVPMDFSRPARRALELARDLGSRLGPAHLVLVHAYFVPPEIEALGIQSPDRVLGDLREKASQDLERMLVDLQDSGVSAEYFAERGSPDRVIVELAGSKRADLIAMGTHGRSGLSHVLLGSVAERVVRQAPCPVITAKG